MPAKALRNAIEKPRELEKRRRALGIVLRRLRKNKKLTQQTVADESGISQAYLCLVEKGERIAEDKVLLDIAKALDIDFKNLELFVDAAIDFAPAELREMIRKSG